MTVEIPCKEELKLGDIRQSPPKIDIMMQVYKMGNTGGSLKELKKKVSMSGTFLKYHLDEMVSGKILELNEKGNYVFTDKGSKIAESLS